MEISINKYYLKELAHTFTKKMLAMLSRALAEQILIVENSLQHCCQLAQLKRTGLGFKT
jgi:hypothetical protein